jgi:YD repeat-containing protein
VTLVECGSWRSNCRGILSTVVDNRLSGSNTTTYSYDGSSNLATASYPNGLQTTFAYLVRNIQRSRSGLTDVLYQ